MDNFYDILADGGKASVLSVLPKHCEQYVPSQPCNCPPLLGDMFEEDMLAVSYDALLDRCDHLFSYLSVSAEEIKAVEELTRGQSSSKAWFQFRAGRVTASRFKAAACTDASQPSASLILSISYPSSPGFSTAATKWGCTHECVAQETYEHSQRSKHRELKIKVSGFVISHQYPFIGASPDGLVSCLCCGPGLLEVKCPFNCKSVSLADAAESAKFCLELIDGKMQLKSTHTFFYQVQAQLLVCEAKYCDFVVWSEKDLFIQRVLPDKSFTEQAMESITAFFKLGIMLELVGKWFSKPFYEEELPMTDAQSESLVSPAGLTPRTHLGCYCDGSKDGDVVICANAECSRKRFHLQCLKLKQKPKRKWQCPQCRKKKRA